MVLEQKENDMRTKIYKLPNGKTVIFDHDENGVGKVTAEAMDSIMDMLGAEPTGPTVKEEIKEERMEWQPFIYDGVKCNVPEDMDGKWIAVTNGKTISLERIKKDAYDHFYPSCKWFELEDVTAWKPVSVEIQPKE